ARRNRLRARSSPGSSSSSSEPRPPSRSNVAAAPAASASEPWESVPAGVLGPAPQLLLDPEQLVVLGDAVRARGCPGLDLADPGRDGQVRDRRVLRLAGAV